MPKTYTCEKCARIFQKKCHYTDHMKKKNDCSKTSAIAPILEENKELKEEVKEMRVATQGEVTKETLPAFFENLHNLLWNRAGLSPERALEHMTFFFAYRMMELQADALHLPDICRWSYVAGLKSADDLYATLDHGTAYFLDNAVTSPFFKQHEIKSAEVVWDIVHEINRIPLHVLQETDTLGDIFEYMLSRGMSTMADEGQYYTNRKICRLAFTLAYRIRQALRRPDGTLCTFGDWFCGTGGFPAEYIRGVNQNLSNVDWNKDSASIYCQDMNMSSVTTTLLNLLIQTGTPFNGVKKTIQTGNSFQQNITHGTGAIHRGLLLDYSFMNPPYGGDKSKGKAYKFAYSVGKGKDKRFLVNQDIQSIGVEDHDKVSAGVQLAMATLAPEGVCCIVLPQGFFFGASAKAVELRQKLAEEYKIYYVVDIASGSFINTGTKTSMLVFQKGVGPTETVQFIGLDESSLVEATLEQLREKKYTLNYKQYLPQEVEEMDGFEMVKLGDVCEIQYGTRITQAKDSGTLYPAYGGGGLMSYMTDKYNRDGTTYKISRDGMSEHNCVMKIVGKYFCNDTAITVHSKDTNCALEGYIGEWLLLQKSKIYNDCSRGTAQLHIDLDTLMSLQIPLPSLARQQQIVDAIDGYTQLVHAEEQSLKLLEKSVMWSVKEMGNGKERVRLGDVCEFQRGKMITKKELVEGEFPVIGGGLSPMGYHNLSNRIAYTSLISQSGENAGHISRYTTPVWASDCFSVSSSKINDDYLYYLLLQIQDNINFLKTGTAQPHIYPSSIDTLQIPLPSLAEQQTLQSDFDEIRHKHAKIAEYKVKAQEAILRLIPGATSSENQTTPSEVPVESHSSTCNVQADGTGCTCRVGIMEEAELAPVEAPSESVVASLPSSTLADSAPKKKMRRPRLSPTAKLSKKHDEAE